MVGELRKKPIQRNSRLMSKNLKGVSVQSPALPLPRKGTGRALLTPPAAFGEGTFTDMWKKSYTLCFSESNKLSACIELKWPPSLSFLNISEGCAQRAACSTTKPLHWEDSAGTTEKRAF